MRSATIWMLGLLTLLTPACFGGDDGGAFPPDDDTARTDDDDGGELCTLVCEDGDTLDPAACACLPPNECGEPVDPARLVGKAWRLDLTPKILSEHCASPPTLQALCNILNGPRPLGPDGGGISLLIRVTEAGNGSVRLSLQVPRNNTDPPWREVNVAEARFGDNPCLSAEWHDFDMYEGYIVPEMAISATIPPDLGPLELSVLRLILDPQSSCNPADVELCIDICSMGQSLCEPDGLLHLHLVDLEASLVESPAP